MWALRRGWCEPMRADFERWYFGGAASHSADRNADGGYKYMPAAQAWNAWQAGAKNEREALRTGHQRYETARRMNPRQWAAAWDLNLKTGKPFDEIIDDMRPFMGHNA